MFSSSLGKGEVESLVLALESRADVVLLDYLRARKVARRLKVKVMGTLAILKVLLDLRLVKESPEILCEKLINTGFWVDPDLSLKALKGYNVPSE